MEYQTNASDSSKVESAKQKEKLRRDREIADLKAILESAPGRRVLWRILEKCGIYKQSAVQSGSWTYFNEGQRSVGNQLLAEIIQTNPEFYLQMIKENKENDL